MEKREVERTEFGQRIRAARNRVGLMQIPAAKAIGIGQSALAELEKTGQGSSHVTAMARVYRCDAHWLATGEGDPRFDSMAAEQAPVYGATGETIQATETDWTMLDAFQQMSDDDRDELLKVALERAERHKRVTAEVLRKFTKDGLEPKTFEPTERVPGKSGFRYIQRTPAATKTAPAAKKAPKGAA